MASGRGLGIVCAIVTVLGLVAPDEYENASMSPDAS